MLLAYNFSFLVASLKVRLTRITHKDAYVGMTLTEEISRIGCDDVISIDYWV